ncbi:MAG: hypothetical protein DCC55_15770 [Chloroflexi bacterium]|nr:MAG: hypothetical protein DCC55_15770 [Chloroflexota bacterium]
MDIATLIVVRSLVYFGAGYLINRLAMRLRQQQASLTAASRRLVDLASTQEHLSTSRERNRMAREFQDTLAHTLSALTLQLETLKQICSRPGEGTSVELQLPKTR